MFRYVLIFLVSLTSLLVNADAKPLKIVCHEFAPFSFRDSNNQITGILVEIARLACKSWEQGCEIELLPNKRAKKAFHSGQANGHFLGWNEERATSIWFSVPMLETEYGFYSLKQSNLSKINLLSGKLIGVLAPSNTYQSLLTIDFNQQQLGLEPMKIIMLNSANQQPLKMLAIGRFDAYFVNRDVGSYYAIQLNISDLDYLSSNEKTHYYLGFKMQYNNYDTIKSFNHHLATLLHQGVFEPLFKHWHVKTPKLNPSQYPSLNIPF